MLSDGGFYLIGAEHAVSIAVDRFECFIGFGLAG
tara:strand:+ start:898 stop:999 length:102 start_codon:yes stop_codon:yes gene_type:complete